MGVQEGPELASNCALVVNANVIVLRLGVRRLATESSLLRISLSLFVRIFICVSQLLR